MEFLLQFSCFSNKFKLKKKNQQKAKVNLIINAIKKEKENKYTVKLVKIIKYL